MPIIGTNTVYPTTIPALETVVCRNPTAAQSVLPPNATPVKRALQWSHSEVFVTPFGTSTALERMNVADLTTVFTPLPSCVDRWMLFPPQSCSIDSTSHNVVWSVNPKRSIVSDASYNQCQRYGTATYSPGVCPSGQTVAEITAYVSSASNSTRTFWQASCCRRFDNTSAFFVGVR